MSESDKFELWFNNQSGAGGRACVYQPVANVTFSGTGPQQLAWLMAGANPSVWCSCVDGAVRVHLDRSRDRPSRSRRSRRIR